MSTRKADYKQFDALNVQILGISADNPFSQKTFADSLELPYPLLSDFPGLKTIRRYAGVNRNVKLTTRFFLVDLNGIVRGQWIRDSEEVFPSEAILEAIREIVGKS